MEQRARGAHHRERLGRGLACVLVLWTCANFIIHVSADTTAALTATTQPPNADRSTSSGTLKPQTSSSGSDSPATTLPEPNSLPPETPSPANLGTTVSVPSTIIPTKSSSDFPTTRLPATQSSATAVDRLSTTTSTFATTIGPSKAPTTPLNTTTNSTSLKTVTPADYVIHDVTWNPAPTPETTRVATTPQGDQTSSAVLGSTSGSVNAVTTAAPTVTSTEFETSVVVVLETVVLEITDGQETVEYVTPNGNTTIGGGPGLDPDREKDELKKLLFIVGGSIGGALVAILIIFAIVYRFAKRRKQRANSRYYNFKKKKSNYEKVLHLQEYYGEVDTDNSSAGTGAAWVFQENEGDASKTITLELDPKDKEKPVGRSGRRHKSRNKNKNNRNKSGVGRGNYQVLAEMFPTRNIPPDVLLSADGAVHSNSEDEEGAILDTCFGASLVAHSPEDRSDVGSAAASDRLSSKGSFNSGGKSSWPAWNNRPYVTIRPEDDTVVEL
ncbi:cell wall integrity and stress response component 4-like [Patiria miniata]|uniref:Uncharacterized protein n=1 Tax=Patiria miniata TaxID=46514 RepID=A0A914A179_PATMI|nr:cell wall integrity and stress response component 4-like [Patiria miniata]